MCDFGHVCDVRLGSPGLIRTHTLVLPMTYVPSRIICLCAIAVLAACSDMTQPSAPAATAYRVIPVNDCSGPATSESVAITGTFGRTIDDDWADIARTIPGGFAGVVYATAGGNPTILLTDTTQAASARAALKPLLAQMNPMFDVDGAAVRQARWNAAQLLDWHHYLAVQPIWAGSNVTSTDIDEAANRIRINTADSVSQAAFVSRLTSMNLPCALVVVGVMAPATIVPGRP